MSELSHDEMCASHKGRACNCGAEGITHAPDCRFGKSLGAYCNCGALPAKLPHHDSYWCTVHKRKATHRGKDGLPCCDPSLGGILLKCHVVNSIVHCADLTRQLAEAIAQRDEARKKLATWEWAFDENLKGNRVWFPRHDAIQAIPPDEGAIRAMVDALENEHRHVEYLLRTCPTEHPMVAESRQRMKSLAGLLERLCNTPLYIPHDPSNT